MIFDLTSFEYLFAIALHTYAQSEVFKQARVLFEFFTQVVHRDSLLPVLHRILKEGLCQLAHLLINIMVTIFFYELCLRGILMIKRGE